MRGYDVVVERDEEDWYIGSVADLAGCHTQGRSLDELMERMPEAIDASVGAVEPRKAEVGIGRIIFAK